MSGVEYLREYYPFDDEVMSKLQAAESAQAGLSWLEYSRRRNLPNLVRFDPKDGKTIEVLDVCPKEYNRTVTYHMPMGCLLDANTMTHVTTLADAEPNVRVISVSNPGQPGHGTGKLGFLDAKRVWSGDMRPLVGPTLEYLNSQAIESSYHVGMSYGADKAAAAAENAHYYDQHSPRGVMVEPVSVDDISMVKMGIAFAKTGKFAEGYGDKVPGTVFKSAQEYKESAALYPVGIVGRISNLAIAHALAHSQFEDRLTRAMLWQADMRSAIFWGTESELATNQLVKEATDRMIARFGKRRVVATPLPGQRHSMNVDPFLNAALVLQGLKKLD